MIQILLNHGRQPLNRFGIAGERYDCEPIGKANLFPARLANRDHRAAVRHERRAHFETSGAPVLMIGEIRSALFYLLRIVGIRTIRKAASHLIDPSHLGFFVITSLSEEFHAPAGRDPCSQHSADEQLENIAPRQRWAMDL